LFIESRSMPSDFLYERRIITNDIALWELSGAPSIEEWRSLLDSAGRWLLEQESRGRQWGIIVDPSNLENISAEIRKEAGQWRAENMALIANTCICASYVAPSALVRGAITAVFWFAKPVVPVSVRGTQEDAHQWVVTKMNDLSVIA
jgi:hypothetical protein